ncbi:MoaD/ThiS family protein [Dehalobacter sp. DCM]|uniref:MoaD/ThiS family protein n=1 Tax=Dehalobacter sp. DCM TaxID=2907827 RepID=UPI003081937B|nr:MoaD/ThiS family protein [Dehalobacter sp. DCM]
MIKVNNREYEWQESQTFHGIREMLIQKEELKAILEGNYMLMINGRYVSPGERDQAIIADNDTLLLLPSATGG